MSWWCAWGSVTDGLRSLWTVSGVLGRRESFVADQRGSRDAGSRDAVAAQMQYHMDQELRKFLGQMALEADADREVGFAVGGQPALLLLLGLGSQSSMIPGCPQKALVSSKGRGAL